MTALLTSTARRKILTRLGGPEAIRCPAAVHRDPSRDLLTAELVCVDPPGWVGKLTANPGVWVQAQPGVGKSAITKRILLGLIALGHLGLVPADIKGEYAGLVAAVDGQVVRVGRGLDRINPLDAGPLGRALPGLSGEARAALAAEVAARRADLVVALLSTPNGLNRRPSPGEQFALTAAIRLLTDAHAGATDPVIVDVVRVLRDPPGPLLSAVMADDTPAFRARFAELVFALENLVSGPLAGLFDGPTTRPIDLTAKAVSVDLHPQARRRAVLAGQAPPVPPALHPAVELLAQPGIGAGSATSPTRPSAAACSAPCPT